ncbi:unnamed protein product, partial [Phaeothamnion confervicola]
MACPCDDDGCDHHNDDAFKDPEVSREASDGVAILWEGDVPSTERRLDVVAEMVAARARLDFLIGHVAVPSSEGGILAMDGALLLRRRFEPAVVPVDDSLKRVFRSRAPLAVDAEALKANLVHKMFAPAEESPDAQDGTDIDLPSLSAMLLPAAAIARSEAEAVSAPVGISEVAGWLYDSEDDGSDADDDDDDSGNDGPHLLFEVRDLSGRLCVAEPDDDDFPKALLDTDYPEACSGGMEEAVAPSHSATVLFGAFAARRPSVDRAHGGGRAAGATAAAKLLASVRRVLQEADGALPRETARTLAIDVVCAAAHVAKVAAVAAPAAARRVIEAAEGTTSASAGTEAGAAAMTAAAAAAAGKPPAASSRVTLHPATPAAVPVAWRVVRVAVGIAAWEQRYHGLGFGVQTQLKLRAGWHDEPVAPPDGGTGGPIPDTWIGKVTCDYCQTFALRRAGFAAAATVDTARAASAVMLRGNSLLTFGNDDRTLTAAENDNDAFYDPSPASCGAANGAFALRFVLEGAQQPEAAAIRQAAYATVPVSRAAGTGASGQEDSSDSGSGGHRCRRGTLLAAIAAASTTAGLGGYGGGGGGARSRRSCPKSGGVVGDAPAGPLDLFAWGNRSQSGLFAPTAAMAAATATVVTEQAAAVPAAGLRPEALSLRFFVPPERVACVACSARHAVVVTSLGNVFTTGEARDGALGRGDPDLLPITISGTGQGGGGGDCGGGSRSSVFAPVEWFAAQPGPPIMVVQAAVGSDVLGCHSACVDAAGRLYTWGIGAAAGQGSLRPAMEPAQVRIPLRSGGGGDVNGEIDCDGIDGDGGSEVNGPSGGAAVRSVACGGAFTLALTMDGDVYAFGAWARGRLGLGRAPARSAGGKKRVQRFQLTPRRVEGIGCGGGGGGGGGQSSDSGDDGGWDGDGNRVVQVACGAWHALAVTAAGELYSWGHNGSGQLGHAAPDVGIFPRDLAAMTKAASLLDAAAGGSGLEPAFSGKRCSLADAWLPAPVPPFVNNSTVAAIGAATAGSRGGGGVASCDSSGSIIWAAHVACGHSHSVAVDAGGAAWTWGARGGACLGHGDPPSEHDDAAAAAAPSLAAALTLGIGSGATDRTGAATATKKFVPLSQALQPDATL